MDHCVAFVRSDTSRIVLADGAEARLPDLLRELGSRRVVVVHGGT